MKGFLKKSIQSARKPKPGGKLGVQKPRIGTENTLVDLTESSQSLDPKAGSETNDSSTTQSTAKDQVDLETKNPSRTQSARKAGGEDPEDAAGTTEISLASGPEVAQKQLLKASKDLEEILRLYFKADNASAGIDEDYDNIKPPLSPGKDGFDADKLANLLSTIVSRQSHQASSSLSSKVSSAFGQIYPLVNTGMRVGYTLGDAFPPVKAAMGSLTVLFSIMETERARSEDFLLELQKITYQSSRIAQLRKSLAEHEMGDPLIERSTRLLTAIIVYFKDSIIYLRHNYFYNLGKVLVRGEQVYSDAKTQLQLAIQEYDQALLLQIAISTLSTRPKQGPLDENASKVPSDLIRWLDSAYWETEAQFSTHKERRQEGTLLWMLDMDCFKRWRADEASRLWLTGPPGVGKSILAAYLVQLLSGEDPGTVVLYFFCSAGNAKLNTLPMLIRTLAAQIAMSVPSSIQHFRQLKHENFESDDCSLLFAKLVQEPLNSLQKTKYIVIDGLDECLTANDDAGVILNSRNAFLRNFQRTEAKIVFLSRPIPNALEHLGTCLHHRITDENTDDIQAYVSKRLARSPVLRKGFDRLQEKEPEKLLSEKAHGNFLWVAVSLGLLEKNSASTKAFQATIDNIPDSLSQVYDQLLDRLYRAGTLELARVILGCILCSMSPLTVESLYAATTILYEDVIDFQEFIELECGSFLSITPTTKGPSTVQVAHETFKSYIMNDDSLGARGLSRKVCHLQLAMVCLESLASEDENLECLRDYAAEHWLAHFVAFQAAKSKQLPESAQLTELLIKLHGFLTDDRAFSAWIRRCVFIIQEDTRMRYFCFDMRQMANKVLAWLQSPEVEKICSNVSNEEGKDPNLNAAARWRDEIVAAESRELKTFMCRNLSRTWLGTNWCNYSLSQLVFIHCLKTAKMLGVIASPGETFEPNKKVMGRIDYASISTDQLDELARLGGFKQSIGVQAGNFAFGGFHANHPVTGRYFLSAIDEHPEWWHLHEGLGEWYYRVDRKEDAVDALEEAIDHSPRALRLYWGVKVEVSMQRGDIPSAIETLRKAEALCTDEEAYKYIDQMATIYKDRKEWENVKEVYSRALEKRSMPRAEYWLGLVETYSKCYDWRGQLRHLLLAIEDNSGNLVWLCRKIGRLAEDLSEQMLFTEAVEVLDTAIAMESAPPGMQGQFQVQLARTYLASRQWEKAIDVCTAAHKDDGQDDEHQHTLSSLLGNAYLARGDIQLAVAEFEKDSPDLPETVALAHMVAGEFKKAIRLFKRHITKSHELKPQGPEDTVDAGMLMATHLSLGECYSAVGRTEDSVLIFQEGLLAFDRFANEHKNIPSPYDSQTPIFRCEARPFRAYGDLLSALDRDAEAREYYEAAETIMSKTRFVGDDDILECEYEQCVRRIENLSLDKSKVSQSLEQKRENWTKSLELGICESYRMNWYSFMDSAMPRYRGGPEGWASRMLGCK